MLAWSRPLPIRVHLGAPHAVLPIAGKRDSDWGYAAVPVVGPLIGAVLAAWLALVS